MVKKIILWGFYLLFVGGLIWAATNRSSAVLTESSQNHGGNSNSDSNAAAVSVAAISEEHQHEAEAGAKTFIALNGTLTIIGKRDASITLENGTLLTLNSRSWRFAGEQGFQAQVGDALSVTVFYEGEKVEVTHLLNLENGSAAQLRDENGHPLWNSNNGN